jgi:hypothetical protein
MSIKTVKTHLAQVKRSFADKKLTLPDSNFIHAKKLLATVSKINNISPPGS